MNDFINNILEKTKLLTNVAIQKTGDVYESSKLKVEALKIDNKIKAAYEKLGITMYAMVKEDYNDKELIDSLVADIDELYSDLEDITEEIDVYKNAIICPSCESKNNYKNIYCANCGKELLYDDDLESYDDNDFEVDNEEYSSEDFECDCDKCCCGCDTPNEDDEISKEDENKRIAEEMLNDIYENYEQENDDLK